MDTQKAPVVDPQYTAVIVFLRNKSGMKVKTGVLGGKRVDYFRGRSAIKALLSPSYAKLSSVPKVTSESEASQLLAKILPYDFFLRIIRGASTTPSGPGAGASIKTISVDPQQHFASDEFYVWVYDADQTKMLLLAFGMVLIVLAAVMFPLWPVKLRIGVWYLSMAVLGLLGLFFGIAILRLILWLITIVVAKPGIWIFPELFADVGFFESFVPLWDWDIPVKKGSKSKSLAGGSKKSRKDRLSKSGTATPLTGDDSANSDARIVEIEE